MIGENTLHPLQIEDARQAAYAASENQRTVEDRIRQTSQDLAEAERAYRKALATKIVELRAAGNAVTACEAIAKGDPVIADLRYSRDVAAGVHDATRQEAYRRGADRKAVDALLEWSMKRDLRVDTPPAQYPAAIGGQRAA